MRKRINNDFDALVEVFHEGVKIDLSLYEITSVRMVSNQAYPVTDYEIRNGSLFLHVAPLIVPKPGKYKIVVSYRIADPALADGFWNYEFDKYLVTIVGCSEEEDAGEVVITADAVIGMRGDKGDAFTYSDFTPEQLEALKVKGGKGDPFLYSDFTPEQLLALKGEQGADGVGLNYLGTVATSANLNPSYQGLANDAFVTEDLGRAWKWTGTGWLDVGSFSGEKGDPFLYSDFTPEQLEALKVKGDKGDAFLYEDFTPEQLEALKVKGDAFTYEDFTPEQLEALKVKGDPFLYSDFTPEQLLALKGDKGDAFLYEDFTPEQFEALKVKGDKGDPFLYSDFTPEQLEALKVKGDKGDPFLYSDFTPEQLEALKVKGDPLTYADLTEANKTDLRQPIYDDLLSIIYAGL